MANRILQAIENAVEAADQETVLWFNRMVQAQQDGDVFTAKEYEIKRNDAGGNKEAAEKGAKRVREVTEAHKSYVEGKLPKGHIHARAKRYAVKLFLSHLHGFWYQHHFGVEPPLPYPIAHLGHVHTMEAA